MRDKTRRDFPKRADVAVVAQVPVRTRAGRYEAVFQFPECGDVDDPNQYAARRLLPDLEWTEDRMRHREAPLDPAAQTPRGRSSGGGRAGGGDEENGEDVEGQAYPAGQRVPDAIRSMAEEHPTRPGWDTCVLPCVYAPWV